MSKPSMFHLASTLAGFAAAAFISTGVADAQGKRLARADRDNDGKISLQEFIAARGKIFDRIDANHDGQITREEVAAFQARLENVEAGVMIRRGKAGAGGGARQLERVAALTANGPLTRAQWDAVLTKRFQKLDASGSGYITMDQMRPGKADAAPAEPMAPAPKS